MSMGNGSGWVHGRRKNGNRIHSSQPCKAAVEQLFAGESESSQLQAGGVSVSAFLQPRASLDVLCGTARLLTRPGAV